MTLTNPDLFEIDIEASFIHNRRGRIVAANEPDGDPAPRFLFCRLREGNRWRVGHEVPDDSAMRLEDLAASEAVRDDLRALPDRLDAMLETLNRDAEVTFDPGGPAYSFPDMVPAPVGVTRITHDNIELAQQIIPGFGQGEPSWVMMVGDRAVSICHSVRISARASVAGVETVEEYRGRGYAPAVVAAWARAVRETGRIPFYGTSWDNLASRAVARKLGLVMYGAGISMS
jgi:RimJ/RimL family protein N-acetyltransferase